LFYYESKLYVLDRKQNALAELDYNCIDKNHLNGKYIKIKNWWSFKKNIDKGKNSSGEATGVTEGLAIDDNFIYIVTDENGKEQSDLYIFRNPIKKP